MAEKTHYISNNDLMNEYAAWLSSAATSEERTVSERFALMMTKIAERILTSRYFGGYPQTMRADMQQEACLKMIANLRNYRADKGSLFSYLSRICFCSNATFLKKHYRRLNAEREMSLSANEKAPQTARRRSYLRAMRQKVEEYR